MKDRFFNEENGLWYEKQGDQYYPCLAVPEQEIKPIGVWGKWHLEYLKEHRKGTYTTLLTDCKLNEYLAGIDEEAQTMFNSLVIGMAEREGITEQLKAENQMEWVQRMNNCKASAEEVVLREVIYQ